METSTAPLRVLFVGNSQTHWGHSIPDLVTALGEESVVTDEIVMGGAGLEQLWNDGRARRMIESGAFDWVVVQEMINVAEEQRDNFERHATLFHDLITSHGARTMLFATGHIEGKRQGHPVMYEANLTMARRLRCRVAGGGMAWLTAWERDATLDLYAADRAHPGLAGYYLNACVLYAGLTGQSPVGKPSPPDLDPTKVDLLQKIAWDQSVLDRQAERAAV